jgi:hypothetical protein
VVDRVYVNGSWWDGADECCLTAHSVMLLWPEVCMRWCCACLLACCCPQNAILDASSSLSRADVLGIIMSAVLLLTGLQWLSLKPRVIQPVSDSAAGPVQESVYLLRGFTRARCKTRQGIQAMCYEH